MNTLVDASRVHLSDLLIAIERCVFFLEGARVEIAWPLSDADLASRTKDIRFFTTLSAINERFAKLQDTLGSAMRHASMLAGEHSDTFLRVLTYFEKVGVLGSLEDWQTMRTLRNLADHEYGTEYAKAAEHFNALNELIPQLYAVTRAFASYCRESLGIEPTTDDFSSEFWKITRR
ncbi:MAG: hypothetical protein PHS63_05720 [Desulfoplanes sp.]|nr:hypothetical protein [Desulfoplanes sp.]